MLIPNLSTIRIAAGDVNQYIYFTALNENDSTRLTGLNSFSAYYSQNGNVVVNMQSPTIIETNAVTMPGDYHILLTGNFSLNNNHDSEELLLHISHSGMQHVSRSIELSRPKLSLGKTLSVNADGTLSGLGVNSINGLSFESGLLASDSEFAQTLLESIITDYINVQNSLANYLHSILTYSNSANENILSARNEIDNVNTEVLSTQSQINQVSTKVDSIPLDVLRKNGISLSVGAGSTLSSIYVDNAPSGLTLTQLDNSLIIYVENGATTRVTDVSGTIPNLTLYIDPPLISTPLEDTEIVVLGKYLESLQ